MPDELTPIDHEHTALVVMDYQPGVLQRLDGADALANRARRAIATARELGITVAYVRGAERRRARRGAVNQQDVRAAARHGRDGERRCAVERSRRAHFSGTWRHRCAQDPCRRLLHHQPRRTAARPPRRHPPRRHLHEWSRSINGARRRTPRLSAVVVAALCADFDAVHTLLFERVFPRQADVITSDALPEH